MKIEISLDKIEEMTLCIVHNDLNEDEACEYAREMALECQVETINED